MKRVEVTRCKAFGSISRRTGCGVLLLLWLPLGLGCGVVSETHHVFKLCKRTTFFEPARFLYYRSDRLTRMQNEKLASRVWRKTVRESPDMHFTADYARGFVAGFSDYLYRGGSGAPPPIPPREYWSVGRQQAIPQQAILDWFDGFRHGSAECIRCGYRDAVVLPSSIMPSVEDGYLVDEFAESRPAILETVPPRSDSVLPAPQDRLDASQEPASTAEPLPPDPSFDPPNPFPPY